MARDITTKAAPMGGVGIKFNERDGLKLATITTTIKFAGPSSGLAIKPRAFGNPDKKRIRVLWAHSMREPIGKVKSIVADDSRIITELEILLDVQRGAEAIELIKQGAVSDAGLGFRVTKARSEEREGEVVTIVEQAELLEISLASGSVSPISGTIDGAKAFKSADELEDALVQAGIPAGLALQLVERGFRGAKKKAVDPKLAAQLREISGSIAALAARIGGG